MAPFLSTLYCRIRRNWNGENNRRCGARTGGRLFKTCRKAGGAVCDEREIHGKVMGVLRSIAMVYVFIQNDMLSQVANFQVRPLRILLFLFFHIFLFTASACLLNIK